MGLPPKYHAQLLAAERPAPRQQHTPLNDGIIIGTREVLRHAHQRNMPEDDVLRITNISREQFTRVRKVILDTLEAGAKPAPRFFSVTPSCFSSSAKDTDSCSGGRSIRWLGTA